jgi:hypothetical protein
MLIDGRRRFAEFWVRYVEREELLLLDDSASADDTQVARHDLDGWSAQSGGWPRRNWQRRTSGLRTGNACCRT